MLSTERLAYDEPSGEGCARAAAPASIRPRWRAECRAFGDVLACSEVPRTGEVPPSILRVEQKVPSLHSILAGLNSVSQIRGNCWQPQIDRGAMAEGANDRESAAQALHDPPDDREAKATSVRLC